MMLFQGCGRGVESCFARGKMAPDVHPLFGGRFQVENVLKLKKCKNIQ
jgi:hypothetical protein